jgi:molybdate transport system regulatory protein
VSRITRESAQLLELARGVEVLALCKATAITVAAGPPPAGPNVLEGAITRAPRAGAAGEAGMTLGGGLLLVGFVATGSGLRPGSRAWASVEPSAVAIALTG